MTIKITHKSGQNNANQSMCYIIILGGSKGFNSSFLLANVLPELCECASY